MNIVPIMCDQTLAKPQFPENVHGDIHGRVVRDREGAQIHYVSEAQLRGGFRRLGGGVLCEDHFGGADDAVLSLPGVI